MRVLTRDQRLVLRLRFDEDRSLAEIAESLGRTVGSVKALQHRGLRVLPRRSPIIRRIDRLRHRDVCRHHLSRFAIELPHLQEKPLTPVHRPRIMPWECCFGAMEAYGPRNLQCNRCRGARLAAA